MGAVFRLLSAFLIFFLIVGCGLIPLVWRSDPRKLSLANCLSAGFFLAGGMLHMLPEAHEAFVHLSSPHSTAAFMLCCCGIIGTFGIEKVRHILVTPILATLWPPPPSLPPPPPPHLVAGHLPPRYASELKSFQRPRPTL
jgi:zinc transporter ZupT